MRIRGVPEELHRRLKARAAQEGVSMSGYVLREVGNALEYPSRSELLARIRAQPLRRLRPDPAAVIRAGRAGR